VQTESSAVPSQGRKKREQNLSKNGKWRSFPRVPNLLQYVSSGVYFGKVKINGKKIRLSLDTDVWSIAVGKLPDFLKSSRMKGSKTQAPKFKAAADRFRKELNNDSSIKKRSKEYRLLCLEKIETTWAGLAEKHLNEITLQECSNWAAGLSGKIASHYYNNTIGTLRMVIDCGLQIHKENGGNLFENPAKSLKRVRVKQKHLQLPEPSQFKQLLENIRKKSGGWGARVVELVEFLAYSGTRINSEAIWVNWEDVDWQKNEIIIRGHPDTGTKNSEIRRIPILPNMEDLLKRTKPRVEAECVGKILKVKQCSAALNRACDDIGIQRLAQHDLRHLFATRCIEAGVDIPTVARWMGHKDGGALAMKTYGHLRNEHSQAMAAKVKF
jgi:integrase